MSFPLKNGGIKEQIPDEVNIYSIYLQSKLPKIYRHIRTIRRRHQFAPVHGEVGSCVMVAY